MSEPVREKISLDFSLKMDNRKTVKTGQAYTVTSHSAAADASNLWFKGSQSKMQVLSLIQSLSLEFYHFNKWCLESLQTISP